MSNESHLKGKHKFSGVTCVMSRVTCWVMPARGRRMPGHGCRGGHHDHHRHHDPHRHDDHHDDDDDGPGVSMQNLNPYFGCILFVTFHQATQFNSPKRSNFLLSSSCLVASPAPLPQKRKSFVRNLELIYDDLHE